MRVSLGKQRLGNFTRGKKKHLSFFLKRSWSLHKVWYNFSAGHSGISTSHLLSLLCISTLNSDSVILIICSSSSWVKPFSWARFSGKCAWGKANPKGMSAWAPDSKTRSYFSESQAPSDVEFRSVDKKLIVPNNSQAVFRALSFKTFRAYLKHLLNGFDVPFWDDEMAGEQ